MELEKGSCSLHPLSSFFPARLCVPLLSFTTNGPFLSFAAASFIVIVIYAGTLMMYSVLYVATWFLEQRIINGSRHQAVLDARLVAKQERETGERADYISAVAASVFSLREITI